MLGLNRGTLTSTNKMETFNMVTTGDILSNNLTITHHYNSPFTCGHKEHWHIGINKIVGFNPDLEKSLKKLGLIRIHAPQADDTVRILKSSADGPVIFQKALFLDDYPKQIQFFPLVPKFFQSLDFNIRFIKNDAITFNAIKQKTFESKFTLHYVLLKVPSTTIMPKNVEVNSKYDENTYSGNTSNEFRVNLKAPLNTRSEDGWSYITLQNITIPHRIDLKKLLRNLEMEARFTFTGNTLREELQRQDCQDKFEEFVKAGQAHSVRLTETLEVVAVLTPFATVDLTGDLNAKEIARILSIPLKKAGDVHMEYYGGRMSIENNGRGNCYLTFQDQSILDALGFSDVAVNRWLRVKSNQEYRAPADLNLRPLLPHCAYIYANFVESDSYIEANPSKLLAIVPLHEPYKYVPKDGFSLTDYRLFTTFIEANPLSAKINRDSLSQFCFTVKTADGEPFPFYEEPDTYTSLIVTFNSSIQ